MTALQRNPLSVVEANKALKKVSARSCLIPRRARLPFTGTTLRSQLTTSGSFQSTLVSRRAPASELRGRRHGHHDDEDVGG